MVGSQGIGSRIAAFENMAKTSRSSNSLLKIEPPKPGYSGVRSTNRSSVRAKETSGVVPEWKPRKKVLPQLEIEKEPKEAEEEVKFDTAINRKYEDFKNRRNGKGETENAEEKVEDEKAPNELTLMHDEGDNSNVEYIDYGEGPLQVVQVESKDHSRDSGKEQNDYRDESSISPLSFLEYHIDSRYDKSPTKEHTFSPINEEPLLEEGVHNSMSLENLELSPFHVAPKNGKDDNGETQIAKKAETKKSSPDDEEESFDELLMNYVRAPSMLDYGRKNMEQNHSDRLGALGREEIRAAELEVISHETPDSRTSRPKKVESDNGDTHSTEEDLTDLETLDHETVEPETLESETSDSQSKERELDDTRDDEFEDYSSFQEPNSHHEAHASPNKEGHFSDDVEKNDFGETVNTFSNHEVQEISYDDSGHVVLDEKADLDILDSTLEASDQNAKVPSSSKSTESASNLSATDIEALLTEKLMSGHALLHTCCPQCDIPLVKLMNTTKATPSNVKVGVPYCVSCESHKATNESEQELVSSTNFIADETEDKTVQSDVFSETSPVGIDIDEESYESESGMDQAQDSKKVNGLTHFNQDRNVFHNEDSRDYEPRSYPTSLDRMDDGASMGVSVLTEVTYDDEKLYKQKTEGTNVTKQFHDVSSSIAYQKSALRKEEHERSRQEDDTRQNSKTNEQRRKRRGSMDSGISNSSSKPAAIFRSPSPLSRNISETSSQSNTNYGAKSERSKTVNVSGRKNGTRSSSSSVSSKTARKDIIQRINQEKKVNGDNVESGDEREGRRKKRSSISSAIRSLSPFRRNRSKDFSKNAKGSTTSMDSTSSQSKKQGSFSRRRKTKNKIPPKVDTPLSPAIKEGSYSSKGSRSTRDQRNHGQSASDIMKDHSDHLEGSPLITNDSGEI